VKPQILDSADLTQVTNSDHEALTRDRLPHVDQNYAIKVQQKNGGKWRTLRNSRTKEPSDVRIINGAKGKSGVKAPAQADLVKKTSRVVRLSR
jgi:hypothetical protein